ncbi:BspA family leucine-rich repeat surface protein [Allomuricauda sp. NBRC 101325]|uniref:BspA family leucine-rich repeat surface protein n=1 Tax=Allomuricauda sp. NBRC 101325 TaxID=1113758 RepID=UPI002553F6A0|nr:BspA family leucine-rich repeat surface protein [Muricauda sp. NBRC 101325]
MKKNLLLSLLVMVMSMVLSCSKEDDPAPQKKLDNHVPKIEGRTFSVKEDINDTQIIGTLTAEDDDIDDNLIYKIIANSDALFEITQISGAITLRTGKKLDFKATKTHKITVEVNDGTDAATAEITINVTDQNVAPVFDEGYLHFEVSENSTEADVVGALKVSDADGDELSYEILMNTTDNLFVISDEGVIRLANGKGLDFENGQEYTLMIGVNDGTIGVKSEVKITVLNVADSLKEDPNAFVTTWTVQAGGFIAIGTNDLYTYDFTIDWGDGTDEEQITEQNPVHQYTQAGTYAVYIKGQFPAFYMDNSVYAPNLTSIERWGTNTWVSLNKAFYGCSQMVYNATDVPNLTELTDLSFLFAKASNFNGDIGNWDVSNVTNMAFMFWEAAAFDGNIGEWAEKTGNVENMYGMFLNADIFNQDISSWDVGKVQNMGAMFAQAPVFNKDISGWNTISVTSFASMFKLADSFDQNLGAWNFSNAQIMDDMFQESGMTPSNYSATLVGWAANDNANIPDGIDLDVNGQGLEYCMDDQATVDALAKLMGQNSWTIITDHGINCN